jgi:hypothetical protein
MAENEKERMIAISLMMRWEQLFYYAINFWGIVLNNRQNLHPLRKN